MEINGKEVSAEDLSEEKLRNFIIPNSIFYQFEYVAAQNRRTAKAEIVDVMERHIASYKESKGIPDSQVLITEARMSKIDSKSNA